MPKQRRFWQTPQFKELQKEWEEKLKESGFKDEERNGNLYQNASNCYRTQAIIVIENKQRHYELLGHWHHEEDYSCPIEKYVMERWSQGAKIKEISEELKAADKKHNRGTLRKIIQRFEKKWRLKTNKTRS